MAKSDLMLQARILRTQGYSIRAIVKELNVSKASVSTWCRDIKLTNEQINQLLENKKTGGSIGRLKGVQTLKQRRTDQITTLEREGITNLQSISSRELLLLGLGIYWGEGFKSLNYSKFGLSNSDPELIRFMIQWLELALLIPRSDLVFRVQINEICHPRIDSVQEFWYSLTGATQKQFRRPTYITTPQRKKYPNHSSHMGTLIITVKRPSYHLRKVLGLIEGLKQTTIKAV